MTVTGEWAPSRRLRAAADFAVHAHRGQLRKGGAGIPYISHPLAVSALVMEDGGGVHEAMAALLHDVLEDTDARADELRKRFGDEVTRIVVHCTDTIGAERGANDWRERKEGFLARLRESRPDELRVSLADKLHNARSLQRDLMRDPDYWRHFKAPKEDQLWYYAGLVAAFDAAGVESFMLGELRDIVDRFLETIST